MGGGEKARPPQRMKPQPSPAPATLPGVGAAVPELSERGSSTRRKRLGLQLGITPKACEEAIGIDRARRVLTCFAQRPMASARSPTCPHRRSAPAAKEVVPSELHSTPARAVSELGCRHHGRDLRRAAPTSWRARSGSRWPVVCIDALAAEYPEHREARDGRRRGAAPHQGDAARPRAGALVPAADRRPHHVRLRRVLLAPTCVAPRRQHAQPRYEIPDGGGPACSTTSFSTRTSDSRRRSTSRRARAPWRSAQVTGALSLTRVPPRATSPRARGRRSPAGSGAGRQRAAVCFGSTRQSSNGARTVLSSAAAELSAGSVAACDAMYLLAELGGPQPGPTSMFIDDRATVVLVRDPQASQAHRAPPRPALPSRVRRERRPARSGPSTTSRTFSLPPKKFTLFRASMNLSTDTLA